MRRWFGLALAGLVFPAAAVAHVLAPRLELSGFLRRAEVIVRARVVRATQLVSTDPYRTRTRVRVLAVHRGEARGDEVDVIGLDDHAQTYDRDQHVVLFLAAYRIEERGHPAQQRAGEAVLLSSDAEAREWDAYVLEAGPVAASAREPHTREAFVAAAVRALGSTSMRLRAESLRALAPAVSGRPPQALVDSVVEVFTRAPLSGPERLRVLGLVAHSLPPARWLALARRQRDVAVRTELLDVAVTLGETAAPDVMNEALSDAAAAFRSLDPVARVGAAAILARAGDPASEPLLLELAAQWTTRGQAGPALVRPLLRGLFFRARSSSRAAHRALATLEPKLTRPADRRFLEGALRSLPPLPRSSTGPRWLVALVSAGVLLSGLLIWWRRRRTRVSAAAHVRLDRSTPVSRLS